MAGRVRNSALVWDRSGQWAILDLKADPVEVLLTGQVDGELADRDFAAWKKTGALDPEAQAWVTAARKMRNSITQRAVGIELTQRDILFLLQEQGYRCAVTGRAFDLDDSPRQPWQPSVDRIAPDGGYSRGNLRIVCLIVNVAMSAWGEGPLEELARLLVARNREVEPGRGRLRFIPVAD